MKLAEALREECIQIGSSVSDKKGVLEEIARCAKKCSVLDGVDEKAVFSALEHRESLGSTGFGNHIAIPHCALDTVEEFVVGILTHAEGVDFDSLDGEKVNLFVFIIGPASLRNEHIHLLSKISRVLHTSEAVQELLAEKTAVALQETFLRYAADELDVTGMPEKSLFHVFVQIEDLFEDILQVFSAITGCSTTIVRTDDTAHYLNKLPLFSGFFSDRDKGFNRLIVAVVPKAMANEAIRRINTIAGDLNTSTDVMVCVQDVFYCSGNLHY